MFLQPDTRPRPASNWIASHKKSVVQAVVLLLVLFGLSFIGPEASPVQYPELEELSHLRGDFASYASYFQKLAKEKGAVYTFEVLKRASLAPNTDLHLLGHVVGDELYKQKGIDGIKNCTNDFRNACSHSIVVGALLERGEGALRDIAGACRLAPGGKGAYTMCFHGLGHGILAYFQYELPETIKFCERVGTKEYREREYIECVGGTIMELVEGRFGHDPLAWARAAPKYFKADDPLYPCDAEFMPPLVKPQCYTYLTPHLFEFAGADMGHPTPQNFEEAFRFCDAIPRKDKENRARCFGGFGKEFVVLAQNRDIRKIEDMTNEQLGIVAEWCGLAHDARGISECDRDALQSLYWGGENNPDASLRFCNVLKDASRQKSCFTELTGAVLFYIDNKDYSATLCDKYPYVYKNDCRTRLLGNFNPYETFLYR